MRLVFLEFLAVKLREVRRRRWYALRLREF
jgi:hypothetical protein